MEWYWRLSTSWGLYLGLGFEYKFSQLRVRRSATELSGYSHTYHKMGSVLTIGGGNGVTVSGLPSCPLYFTLDMSLLLDL